MYRKHISSTKNRIISLFTKTDLIEDAALESNITGYFPEFPILSSGDDISLIKDGISAMFLQATSTGPTYSCSTCLIDTHNDIARFTMACIKDHVMQRHVRHSCYV